MTDLMYTVLNPSILKDFKSKDRSNIFLISFLRFLQTEIMKKNIFGVSII